MKQRNNMIITGLLYVLIIFFLFEAINAGYDYYKGPTWTVEAYMKALEKGEYEKAYKYLSIESLDEEINEMQMIAYYKQLYNHLVRAQIIGKVEFKGGDLASCKVAYTFQNKYKEDVLQLVRNNKSWEIINPFKSQVITVYAPALSKVYINGKRINSKQEGQFTESGFLPGNYMLQVVMPKPSYKDYYAVIKVPEQTEVIVPYEMVSVGVKTIKGMEVNIDSFSKVANRPQVTFGDILPGEYTLTIKSPYDTITPISQEVTIGRTNCNFNYQDLTLSKKGKEEWDAFINDFYKDYLKGIEGKEINSIANYFQARNKSKQLQLYNDWFIANKDVQDATLKVESQLGKITPQGYLQSEVVEIVELTNLEELEEKKVYRLVLKWDMQVDIMKEKWQIVDRILKESIVSYKTEDGRWIQY